MLYKTFWKKDYVNDLIEHKLLWFVTLNSSEAAAFMRNTYSPVIRQRSRTSCRLQVDYLPKRHRGKKMNNWNSKNCYSLLMDHATKQFNLRSVWQLDRKSRHCLGVSVTGFSVLSCCKRICSLSLEVILRFTVRSEDLKDLWFFCAASEGRHWRISLRSKPGDQTDSFHSRRNAVIWTSITVCPFNQQAQRSSWVLYVTSSSGTAVYPAGPQGPLHFLFPWLLISSLVGANHASLRPLSSPDSESTAGLGWDPGQSWGVHRYCQRI